MIAFFLFAILFFVSSFKECGSLELMPTNHVIMICSFLITGAILDVSETLHRLFKK